MSFEKYLENQLVQDKRAEAPPRKVCFFGGELADVYAEKTLYDYLNDEFMAGHFPYEPVFFSGALADDRRSSFLKGVKTFSKRARKDLAVGVYSDVSCGGDVSVDISILKNCAMPYTLEEIGELKEKYGVPKDKRVLVVGMSTPDQDLKEIVEEASKHAMVYLVGSESLEYYQFSAEALKNTVLVSKYGVLKDYFAMADAAIHAAFLHRARAPLHNFVEACAGGPLFMVGCMSPMQYGYRELVAKEAIVECQDAKEIRSRVVGWLQSGKTNDMHRQRYLEHVMRTRERYLPIVDNTIRRAMGERLPVEVAEGIDDRKLSSFMVMHVETDWLGMHDTTFNQLNKSQLNKPKLNKPQLELLVAMPKPKYLETITILGKQPLTSEPVELNPICHYEPSGLIYLTEEDMFFKENMFLAEENKFGGKNPSNKKIGNLPPNIFIHPDSSHSHGNLGTVNIVIGKQEQNETSINPDKGCLMSNILDGETKGELPVSSGENVVVKSLIVEYADNVKKALNFDYLKDPNHAGAK